MLNSGHEVKHSKDQEDFPQFNIPAKVVPMVPIEKIKEKKFYLGTKKGKVHVITNTVVDMQKAILGTALTSVRKIKKEAE